jgi:hypothetical protein
MTMQQARRNPTSTPQRSRAKPYLVTDREIAEILAACGIGKSTPSPVAEAIASGKCELVRRIRSEG